jgi:signal peptidase I
MNASETVSVHTDAVFISNRRLKEPYIDAAHRPLYAEGPTKVPKDEYFVLGDNRNDSRDSCLWGNPAKKCVVDRCPDCKSQTSMGGLTD